MILSVPTISEPMRFGILGGGFGLYGYLPALLQEGHEVVLPERYRAVLEGRADLRELTPSVHFVIDEDQMFRSVEAMVLAVRPEDQQAKLPLILESPRIRSILLEKPLAPTPESSAQMLSLLEASGVNYRIGYTLLLTDWAEQLRRRGLPSAPWRISWRFNAHHYVNGLDTWKRHAQAGGGALRFYGIHLIALLASFGYSEVREASIAGDGDDCPSFTARIGGPGVPDCDIEVDSKSEDAGLQIFHDDGGQLNAIVELPEPFAAQARIAGTDIRVGLLMSLVRDVLDTRSNVPPWYPEVIDLWAGIEAVAGTRPERRTPH